MIVLNNFDQRFQIAIAFIKIVHQFKTICIGIKYNILSVVLSMIYPTINDGFIVSILLFILYSSIHCYISPLALSYHKNMKTQEERREQAPALRLSRCIQHILNKKSITFRWGVHQNMSHRSRQLAVLYDRTAAHE